MEQFVKEYAGRKILIINTDKKESQDGGLTGSPRQGLSYPPGAVKGQSKPN